MNQVEINACWVEAVRREQKEAIKGGGLNENFSLNPKKLIILSEKPNNMPIVGKNGQKFGRTSIAAAKAGKEEVKVEVDEELSALLKTASEPPRKKYPLPQTSAQEIGWDNDEIKVKPTWGHGKLTCSETNYANSYVTMAGKSPYASESKKD